MGTVGIPYSILPSKICGCTFFQASLSSFLPSGPFYWTGLADFAYEGSYVWQMSYALPEDMYWSSGQPDAADFEDCVVLVSTPILTSNFNKQEKGDLSIPEKWMFQTFIFKVWPFCLFGCQWAVVVLISYPSKAPVWRDFASKKLRTCIP